jgi:AraC-like DNA-binding protein
MDRSPAVGVEAMLRGLKRLGLNRAELTKVAGLDGVDLRAPDAAVAVVHVARLWVEARRRLPREELATEAGLAVPLGAFGLVDYLAGSARTVQDGVVALRDHFPALASGVGLDVRPSDRGVWLCVLSRWTAAEPDLAADIEEFTLAVTVARFRAVTDDFHVDAITLTRRAPRQPTRHADLLGAPVTFEHARCGAHLPRAILKRSMRTTDSMLSRTLSSVADRLRIGAPPSLEAEIRRHLPDLLARGRLDAASLARSLGMSVRTLERRLAATGTRYQRVVDAFRAEQAERMLLDARVTSAEMASFLGFADQTAFIRAFRRWKGCTPGVWVARRRVERSADPHAKGRGRPRSERRPPRRS